MRCRAFAAGFAALVMLTAGCNATKVSDLQSRGSLAPGSKPCGTFNLAINSWVGYEADAAVITYLAENVLGCTVKEKHIDEQIAWQGLSTGQVDAILENWGHDQLKQQYIDNMGVAQSAGSTGNKGQIGWYVPPWMVQKYPDITDWHNLNKYAEVFPPPNPATKVNCSTGHRPMSPTTPRWWRTWASTTRWFRAAAKPR